jgi:hypothetical protein
LMSSEVIIQSINEESVGGGGSLNILSAANLINREGYEQSQGKEEDCCEVDSPREG